MSVFLGSEEAERCKAHRGRSRSHRMRKSGHPSCRGTVGASPTREGVRSVRQKTGESGTIVPERPHPASCYPESATPCHPEGAQRPKDLPASQTLSSPFSSPSSHTCWRSVHSHLDRFENRLNAFVARSHRHIGVQVVERLFIIVDPEEGIPGAVIKNRFVHSERDRFGSVLGGQRKVPLSHINDSKV